MAAPVRVYAFCASGPAELDTTAQVDNPSPGPRIAWGTTAPTTGAWKLGDVCFSMTTGAAGTPAGWVCTVGGSPGTWLAFNRA